MKTLLFAGLLASLLVSPVYAGDKLPQPVLTTPKEGMAFENYPRTATFSWQLVEKAAKYCIEIQCEVKDVDTGTKSWIDYQKLFSTENHTRMDDFAGAQQGRWRVTAIDASGHPGQSSDWRTFRFTK